MYSDNDWRYVGHPNEQQGAYYFYPPQQGVQDPNLSNAPYGNQNVYVPPNPQSPPPPQYFSPVDMNPLNPVLTTFAKQYGESLVGQGRELMDQRFQRFVTLSKLKYYFAVDTAYVMKKMGLLFFPFTHKVRKRNP